MTAPRADMAPLLSDRAYRIAKDHGRHTSGFLMFNDDTSHHFFGNSGFSAYRLGGKRHVLQLGGPVCAPVDRERVFRDFRVWSGEQRRRVTAVQLDHADASLYAQHGFVVNQLGCSYSIDLSKFMLSGRRFVKTRNMINHATRRGVEVEEVTGPVNVDLAGSLDAIDGSWLSAKGKFTKELAFMVGERGGRGAGLRRLFVARNSGNVVGYVSFSPVHGPRSGWLYDLSRRMTSAPPGTIEAIFATATKQFQADGAAWLHLGLTPFTGIADENELSGASSVVRRVIDLITERGQKLYPARTQESFKMKWAPTVIEPEYVAFEAGPSPGALWQLGRVTNVL